jgi:hypothetical protein
MTVEECWNGDPGSIDETCTEYPRMAGAVRLHLRTVEEAEAPAPGILMPVKV